MYTWSWLWTDSWICVDRILKFKLHREHDRLIICISRNQNRCIADEWTTRIESSQSSIKHQRGQMPCIIHRQVRDFNFAWHVLATTRSSGIYIFIGFATSRDAALKPKFLVSRDFEPSKKVKKTTCRTHPLPFEWRNE